MTNLEWVRVASESISFVFLTLVKSLLAPLLLVFSVFVLLRWHNEPGGGFIGGLLAAIAFILINKAEGTRTARRALRILPLTLASIGLSCSLLRDSGGYCPVAPSCRAFGR